MNPIQLFSQLRSGPQSPGPLLGALAALISDGGRVKLAALAELAGGADVVGPRPPPPAMAKLFEDTGRVYGLPPALLAAVAVTLSGMDPSYRDGSRVGIMGLPCSAAGGQEGADAHVCSFSDLLNLEPDALMAVARNVQRSAAELARLRSELPSRMPGALFQYCLLGYAHLAPDDRFARARVDAGRAAGAAVLLGLAELDAEFVEAAAAAFGEPPGGDDV